MIKNEHNFLQYWDIEKRCGRKIYHDVIRIPYIQAEPDNNTWLEAISRAEEDLLNIETITAITFVHSNCIY